MNRIIIRKTQSKAFIVIFSLILLSGMFLQACSTPAPYLVPKQEDDSKGKVSENNRVDIQIKPIYTSGFESDEQNIYHFDFSQFFTAVEVRIHNSAKNPIQWDPFQSILRDGTEKEYKTFNEDAAIDYYEHGDIPSNSIVLLEKPYEQQKEDIESIKRFIVKPVSLLPDQEVKGLLLFKKVSLLHCDNVLLVVAGIKINDQEKRVSFPLECPKD